MDYVRCGVCSETYEAVRFVPLVLPCGHTFCRVCITSISKGPTVECPACRKDHNIVNVGFLPKNFALLSLPSYNCSPGACPVHGDPLRFWCTDCREEICGVCMFDKHPRDSHNVTQISCLVQQKKTTLSEEAGRLLHMTRCEMKAQEKSYSRYEKKLIKLLKANNEICYLHEQVKGSLVDMMESLSIKDITESESKLKMLHTQCERVVCSTGLICPNRRNGEEADAGSLQKTNELSVAMEDHTRLVSLNLRCLNGGNGYLQWDRERLLLFTCPGQMPPTSNGIQMIATTSSLDCAPDTEVFLELSAGNMVLGRVFIRLYRHLRRAKHFLSLCIGTFGPSFRGSRLVAVKRRNEPEESVAGGDYLTPEGVFTARALMTDLEWGGVYAGERHEGLVVGSSGGFVEEDARFGISTSKSASGQCQCPFGEVVEGLDVVRMTLAFNNISEILIQECGMVVHCVSN